MPPWDRYAQQAPAQAPQPSQQPQGGDPIIRPAQPRQAPLPNPVSVATETRQQEQNTFRTMTAEEAAAAGLREGGVYQVNGLGEVKTVNAPPTARAPVANPDRVPQLESILGLIGQLRGESDDTLAVGRMSRSVSETPIIGSIFGQNRANVEGYLQTIEGDLIQQQLARLSQLNPQGVASLANSETEARRMAASIANLDPNQEYGQFITGVQRAEDYYQREYERLTGRRYGTASEGQQSGAQQGRTPVAAGGATDPATGATNSQGGDPSDPDPNGGEDPNGTPLRLMNGDVFLRYERGPNGGLFPQYGPPEPTRTGMAATILGDGTRSIPEQLGAGMGDVLQGVVGTAGMIANPVNQAINTVTGSNLSTDIGATARDMSGLPDNPNQLYSAISQGAASAMTFGGAARGLANIATNPTTSGVLTSLGQTPVRDAAAGAAAGAGAYAARDAGPAGQFAAALGAGALGYGAAGLVGGARSAAGAAQTARRGTNDVVANGNREGVRVFTSDVAPPQNFVSRSVQATGERIPFAGTGGPRAAQQAEREQVVRNIAQEYGVGGSDDFIATVSADLARTRGRQLTGLANRKNRIIDNIPGQVETPLAVAEIDNQIATLQRNFEAEQIAPVVNQLNVFRRALTSGRDLRSIEEQRRLVGDAFASPELASVRSTGEKALSAVYAPLREDMTRFIRDNAGPEVADRFTNTNNRLASMVGELEASNFRRALNQSETTPETAANLLFSRNESDVRRLVENLSPRGRNAAQSAIIYRAISAAGDLNAVAGLSPQQFANAIERYSTNIGVVFRPQDAERLQGVQRLLQATQRASVASANPPTGVQNSLPILTAVLADMMGGAGAGLTTAGVGGLMARIYESGPVRDRLINLARAEPGSPREARTLESLARIMASQPALREALTGAANDNVTLPANVAASPDDQQQ